MTIAISLLEAFSAVPAPRPAQVQVAGWSHLWPTWGARRLALNLLRRDPRPVVAFDTSYLESLLKF